MIERALYNIAFSEEWGRQMRFITGPRQSGKTTLAKLKLKREKTEKLYYLWDRRVVRNSYKKDQLFFTRHRPPARDNKGWVCFDEMHKIPVWKNGLKAIFDSTSDYYQFIITGSVKFDILKRAGDALSGRYFTFHLLPLSLSELNNPNNIPALNSNTALDFIHHKLDSKTNMKDALSSLLEYSGFPEPFVNQSKKFHSKWADDYTDTVIKEDIGALTKIINMEYLYDLYNLLPEMVGSNLSITSLASHFEEVTNPTVTNYLRMLEDFYLIFKVHPYSKNIKRSYLKSPKCYLYDWTRINDQGKRFENYVAAELMIQMRLWMDASERKYELFYIRTKEKKETDFLIVKDNMPWLLIEAKFSDGAISQHHYKIQAMLNNIPFIQVCREEGVCKMDSKNSYRISASRFLP